MLAGLIGTILLGLLLLAGVVLVLRRYRTIELLERQQIRWVLFGLAVAVLMFAVATACRWGDLQTDSYPTSLQLRTITTIGYMASLILFIGAITIALMRSASTMPMSRLAGPSPSARLQCCCWASSRARRS